MNLTRSIDESARADDLKSKKYGLCVLCGDRVHDRHDFFTSQDGYCHKSCITEA